MSKPNDSFKLTLSPEEEQEKQLRGQELLAGTTRDNLIRTYNWAKNAYEDTKDPGFKLHKDEARRKLKDFFNIYFD